MEKDKLHKLLRMFVLEHDDKFGEPFQAGDFNGKNLICATDKHIMVLVPCEDTEIYKVDTGTKMPNPFGVLGDMDLSIPVDMDAVNNAFDRVGKKEQPEMMECMECDGDGGFYHGSHLYTCKECSGTGSVKTGATVLEFDRSRIIVWHGKGFNPMVLKIIMDAIEIIGEPAFVISTHGYKLVFRCGECLLLISGIFRGENEAEKKEIHV